MEKKVTIQDIADSLGLSRNTVSKALNNTGILAEETRQKILTRAADMGYRRFIYLQQGQPEHNAPPGELALLSAEYALRFPFWNLCTQYISGEDQPEQLPAHHVPIREEKRLPPCSSLLDLTEKDSRHHLYGDVPARVYGNAEFTRHSPVVY